MNGGLTQILIIIVVLVLGATIGYFIRHYQMQQANQKKKSEGDRILSNARDTANEIELKARDEALKIRQNAETEVDQRRNELTRQEDKLQKRRDQVDERLEKLERREQNLNKRQSSLDKRSNEIEKIHSKQMDELQRISRMDIDQAREMLIEKVEKDLKGKSFSEIN